jgi:hypothetical protein
MGLFVQGQSSRNVKLTFYLNEVPKLRMNEATAFMPLWRGLGQVYIYLYLVGQANYNILIFKNKSKSISVEINTEAIRMCIKIRRWDPWS